MTRTLLFDVDQTLLYTGGAGGLAMARAFEQLYGVANAFDQAPPQLTREGIGTDQYTMIGNAVLASQYDPFGQRFFVNVTMDFE